MRRLFLSLLLTIGVMFSAVASTNGQQDETPPPDVTIHVVQRGENLYRIALRYGLTIEQIATANGIINTSSIVVGQRLIIPSANFSPTPTQTPQTHIVRAGESLSRIAQLYGLTADMLANTNGITNPNSLYVGQVLQIIGSDIPVSATATSEIVLDAGLITLLSPNQTENRVIHTVQRGDTLYRIAQRYGTTLAAIQQSNGLADGAIIFAGQQLTIPIITTQVASASDLPALVQSLDIFPLVLKEGRAGRILLRTTLPVTVTGSFLDIGFSPISQENGLLTVILIPVPIYTEAGVYPMNFTLTPLAGEVVNLLINMQVQSGNYGSQYITLPADRVDLLNVGVEENEISILRNVTGRVNPERYITGAMSLPAAAVMNSPFGTRRAYNGGGFDRYHNGADFAGATGSSVLAAQAGRVVLADVLNIRGISVVIDHGWGIYTNYSHLSARYVNLGDMVQVGQVLGTVGNTGRATGAHLHWELWLNGVAVDPMQWVSEFLLP
ncbi:MAG: LysM peptidoglycan-binding domain-containing protein [Phototrophicales bacterium]|nr:LysM peptidoglycan-binding domain-containing protein [Phototrophicales bacterium]